VAHRKQRSTRRLTKRKRTEKYGQGTPGVLAEASQNETGQLLDQPGPELNRKAQPPRKRESH